MQPIRRGTILLEAIAAGMLLAVMLALVLRAMSVTAVERRRMEHRAIAVQELAGVLERAAALPFDEVTAERLKRIALSNSIDDLLPRPQLTWTVAPDASLAGGKQIRAALTWQDLRGSRPADLQLSCWVYAPTSPGEESP